MPYMEDMLHIWQVRTLAYGNPVPYVRDPYGILPYKDAGGQRSNSGPEPREVSLSAR